MTFPADPTPVAIAGGVATLTPENTKIEFIGTHVGERPDPRLGTINFFESATTSICNGLTLLLKGQVGQQLFIRTLAKTIDDARVSKAFQQSECDLHCSLSYSTSH